MRKFLVSILTIFFWVSLCMGSKLTKEEFLNRSPHLKKLLETAGGSAFLEKFKDVGPLYEVIIKTSSGKRVVYITKDFKYLILGSLFDKNAQNITKEREKELNKIEISQLPLNEALVQKGGNGEKKVILFVDPYCPHCKNLVNYLKTKENYTLYLYLFPLSDKSKETSLKILCSDKAPIESYLEAEKLEKTCDGAKEKLEKHIALAQKFNLHGTPFVILGDGSNFYGSNLEKIEEYLSKNDSNESKEKFYKKGK